MIPSVGIDGVHETRSGNSRDEALDDIAAVTVADEPQRASGIRAATIRHAAARFSTFL